MQTIIYVNEEADKFYERHRLRRSFIVDYIMTLFPKTSFIKFDVAEFGIGSGSNLILRKIAFECPAWKGGDEKCLLL